MYKHKFAALDSIRGIAAVMVVFQHFWEMNNPADDRLKPWFFFCAGHEAVILFFVLSGFVLSHQLRQFNFADYPVFILKRILRIYPAYYLALGISGGLLLYVSHYHHSALLNYGLTRWFYIWSQTSLDRSLWFGSLTLLYHAGNSLDIAIWTLFYEMWLSVLFPLLLWLIMRSFIGLRILTFGLLLVGSYWLWQQQLLLANPWAAILYYAWYFIFGMLLYHSVERLKFAAGRGFLFFGVVLYFSNYLMFGKITSRLGHELIISLGSLLIIVACVHNPWLKRVMAARVLRFYGRISYSLYLLHMPILSALTYILATSYRLGMIKLVSFGLTTVVAVLSWYLIEIQFIKLAHQPKEKVKS